MNENDPEAVNDESGQALSESFDIANQKSNEVQFFPVSEGKFITLYILSLGLYSIYWFYKNWQLQQPKMDKKIMPFWRAIFSIFFTHSLFRLIDAQASKLESKHRFNPNILATFFVAAIIVSNLLDNLTSLSGSINAHSQSGILIISLALFLLSTYPLVRVQATVNRINNDMLGFLNHKYSIWNYLLIILGTAIWLLLVLDILNSLVIT